MKCPKCSHSLWFSRTYCPFCKTVIPEAQQPGIPSSSRLNWTVTIVWSVWLARELGRLAASTIWDQQHPTAPELGAALGTALGGAMWVGLGAWMALRLYDRPTRGRTIAFLVVCLALLWRYTLANLIIPMLPQFGRRTLAEAMELWWTFVISSPSRILESIAVPVFLLFSIIYWPVYCRWVLRPSRTTVAATSATSATSTVVPAPIPLNKTPGP